MTDQCKKLLGRHRIDKNLLLIQVTLKSYGSFNHPKPKRYLTVARINEIPKKKGFKVLCFELVLAV